MFPFFKEKGGQPKFEVDSPAVYITPDSHALIAALSNAYIEVF